MADTEQKAAKTALVLQGGGARGAYHVGVLRALGEILKTRRSPFQIVCGSSVGAINAASVAMGSLDFPRSIARLEALWRSLHCGSIYDTRSLPLLLNTSRWAMTLFLGHLGLRLSGGFLDYRPLQAMLQKEFTPKHLQAAIRSKALHALCITASSYTEGTSNTFFQGDAAIEDWSRARRRGERTDITADHILASAALPLAFAPVRLEQGYFGDGALRSTSPLSPAIHTGADRILVIATRDGHLDPRKAGGMLKSPSVGDITGHALDILFNDNLDADIERMERVNHTVSLLDKAALGKSNLRRISTLSIAPSQDLRTIAKQHAAELPRGMRLLMRSLGYSGGDGRIESYLMFEPGMVGALIDLGYADTIAQQDAIRSFMQD